MRGSSQKGLAPSTTGGQPIEGPHSRACGIRKHGHGRDCSTNCPTCAGKEPGPIEIGDLPLEGPETIYVPVPLTAALAAELTAYASATGQTVQRAGRQFLEIGMRASRAFVPAEDDSHEGLAGRAHDHDATGRRVRRGSITLRDFEQPACRCVTEPQQALQAADERRAD